MNVESQLAISKIPESPAFLIGVTGYMKLVDDQSVRHSVRHVLSLLSHDQPNYETSLNWLTEQLAPLAEGANLNRFYRRALRNWPVLTETRITVLSSLAPGADTIVAEEALAMGLRVVAPLPFPPDLYKTSSTFHWRGATADENGARVAKFEELIAKKGQVYWFVAPLAEDSELSTVDWEERLAYDLTAVADSGKPRRHARYYAAGEYMANYCHLLLAVWDGTREKSSEGTSAIVEARLGGPRVGVLPTTSHLAQPHGGPVLHIRTCKQGKSDDRSKLPSMRWLHPVAFAVKRYRETKVDQIVAPLQHLDRRLQSERLAMFQRLAANLEQFNQPQIPNWAARKRNTEFENRLVVAKRRGTKVASQKISPSHSLRESELVKTLRSVSDLRCAATDQNYWFDERRMATLRWLFALTLLAAILLDVFAHWHLPQTTQNSDDGHSAVAKQSTSGTSAGHQSEVGGNNVANADGHGPFSPFRTAIGGTAFGLVTVALIIFWLNGSRGLAQQAEDSRALGEGLRVQFYWNLAGLGESVSANYMQRQRTELDWIRGAIRSVCIPYRAWAERFRNLPREQQVAAMRSVEGGWIQDQLRYFQSAYHKRHHALHRWHKLGFVASLAGMFMLAPVWCCYWSSEFGARLREYADIIASWSWILLVVAIVWRFLVWAWLVLCSWQQNRQRIAARRIKVAFTLATRIKVLWIKLTRVSKRTWKNLHEDALKAIYPGKRKKDAAGLSREPNLHLVMRWPALWRTSAIGVFLSIVDLLTPTFMAESQQEGTKFWSIVCMRLYNFVAMLPLAGAIAGMGLCTVYAMNTRNPDWPSLENLAIIAGGISLLIGAMSIAWTEKNLDSELGYQYHTMAGLFQHASLRMERQTKRLEESLAAINNSGASTHERQVAEAEFVRVMIETQQFLYNLGVESLDENAEWLLLHRARPLEPVMAG